MQNIWNAVSTMSGIALIAGLALVILVIIVLIAATIISVTELKSNLPGGTSRWCVYLTIFSTCY